MLNIYKSNNMLKFIFLLLFIFLIFIGCLNKDIKAPEINYIQDNLFISPNGDGIQDEVVFELNIRDENYVKYWKLEIYNEAKEVVKSYSSGGDLEELKKKAVFKKGDVSVPSKISWDGKDEKGKIVKDGIYTFKFIAMDSKKNVTPDNTKIGTITLDTDKPEVKSEISDKIFSPNSDGNKDILYIDIDIIKAKADNKKPDEKVKKQMWYVDIINNKGEVVKRFEYDKKGKQKAEWDGRDNQGKLVEDGVYTVKVYSTDEAGNYWEDIVSNIVIDTKPTPVDLTASLTSFSPNNDNVKDSIDFSLNITIKEGVKTWQLVVADSRNKEIKKFDGSGTPKSKITWDGKDEAGNIQAEGGYKGILTVTYMNGNVSTDESKEFLLDLTPPSATITLSPDIFSPDGNGIQDEVVILQNASQEAEEWMGVFYDKKGKLIKKYSWQGQPPKKFEWNGIGDDNKLSNDGEYFYQLICTDTAGNTFTSPKYKTEIYTKDNPIVLTATLNSFSPNNDKEADTQYFEVRSSLSKRDEVKDWKLDINNKTNKTVYTLNKSGDLPDKISWDGKGTDGKIADDGQYSANLTVNFRAGTVSTTKSNLFLLDNTPPEFSINVSPQYFSPDDDGYNDELFIDPSGKDDSGIKSWKIIIYTPELSREFMSFEGTGEPVKRITWNGIGIRGELVESVEDYPVKLIAYDNVGNKFEKDIDPIMIDILVIRLPDGRLKIKISNIEFKPNKAEMTNAPKNKEILDKLARALKKYDEYNITLEGYANRFAKGLNEREAKDLSHRRSEFVAKELTKKGIKKERMTIVGKGFDDPIIPLRDDMTEEERKEMRRNRRVEFYLKRE